MSELKLALVGDSAHTPPAHVVEGLTDELVHRLPHGAPHSIYEEFWHIAFWQKMSLDWIAGVETPFPANPREGFPTVIDSEKEYWGQLCERFFAGNRLAAEAAHDQARLNLPIRCPSRPGEPVRVMTVRDQLISLAAHNAYHFGRIVLLRQLLDVWPPQSGGFSW